MTTHGWQFGVSDVANLPTSETDTGKVLAPDGSGGLTWVTASAGVTDHGALSGLLDDDHTQYHTDARALSWHGAFASTHVTGGDSHAHSAYLAKTGADTGATSSRQTFTNAVNTSAHYEIGTTKTIHAPGTRNVFLGALTGAGTVTGADNIGIGVGALQLFGAGTGNMAIGSNSLNVLSAAGTFNVAIGPNAMDSVTAAVSSNIAIGRLALSKVAANNNVAIGLAALTANVLGFGNLGIGSEALTDNDSGVYNSAIGIEALKRNVDGINCTAVGPFSASNSTSADSVLALGYAAAFSNTADGTVAIGALSAYTNTSGTNNIAIGNQALYTNSTNVNCIAIGNLALYASVANQNLGIGYGAGRYITTGANNVAIGAEAMGANSGATTANQNIAIGNLALAQAATTVNCIAIGYQALQLSQAGYAQIAIGVNALRSITSYTDHNVGIGTSALTAVTSGSGNVALGSDTLTSTTTQHHSVAIGRQAGQNATGDNCIYIGVNAGANNSRASSLFIDTSTSADPLIYGELDNDKVGINKSGPGATMHIASTATSRKVLILETAAGTVTAPVLVVQNSGANALLTLNANGRDWTFDTTTGTKHGTATGEKQAWWGATPVVRPSAYTQTYSTADKTLSAYTSDPESSAYTGIDNAQGGTPYAQLTDLNTLRVAYDNLRVFSEDLAAFVNSLVDDMQTIGMVG